MEQISTGFVTGFPTEHFCYITSIIVIARPDLEGRGGGGGGGERGRVPPGFVGS